MPLETDNENITHHTSTRSKTAKPFTQAEFDKVIKMIRSCKKPQALVFLPAVNGGYEMLQYPADKLGEFIRRNPAGT